MKEWIEASKAGSERVRSITGAATETRAWGKVIKIFIIGILIAYLALGGLTAVFALLSFMPWYAWAIIGVIIVLLLRK